MQYLSMDKNMNRISHILALLLLMVCGACSSGSKRPLIIEYPHTETKSSGLTLTKLELTDSSTVLSFHVDCPKDYWLRLASTTYIECDGYRYVLESSDGLVPDEKFWIPTNYGHDFTATFPAIPENATEINFAEGDAPEHWRIYGIKVTKSN